MVNKILGRKIKTKEKEGGFALFYTLLIIGVVLTATSAFLETSLEELFVLEDREESDVALYMAEAGIECAIHHQIKNKAFNMREEEDLYFCSDGNEFTAGWKTDEFEELYQPGSSDSCYWDSESILFTGLLDLGSYKIEENQESLGMIMDPFVIWNEDNKEACARVFVEVVSVRRNYGEQIGDIVSCDISITSVGASKCDSDGLPAEDSVEKTRVERRTN